MSLSGPESHGAQRDEWVCKLSTNGNGGSVDGRGRTARDAIQSALEQADVELP
jgi:hypothetical protein